MTPQAIKGMMSKLRQALRTLEQDQGPRARRNARARVAAAIRSLRTNVERSFPAPARKPADRTRRTPQQIIRDLKEAGWEQVTSMEVMSRIAAAGIRVSHVERITSEPSWQDPGMTWRSKGRDTYAPGWAVTIASQRPGKLGRAKASIRERKAILTELSLGNQIRGP